MNLATDEFTKRSVNQLMSTKASLAVKDGRDDGCLVVPRSVRPDFDRSIWEALFDKARDYFGIHAVSHARPVNSLTQPAYVIMTEDNR